MQFNKLGNNFPQIIILQNTTTPTNSQQIILKGNSANPTDSTIEQFHNTPDTGDIISIRSNLNHTGSTWSLGDPTQAGWNLDFGAFSNAFNVQSFQVGGSLKDMFTISSSGSVLMNQNAHGLNQNDNASVNRNVINLDASNNVQVGDLGLGAASQIAMNGIPYFVGTTGTTASTAAVLSATSPSVGTAVYKWIKVLAPDGSTVYIPCWK